MVSARPQRLLVQNERKLDVLGSPLLVQKVLEDGGPHAPYLCQAIVLHDSHRLWSRQELGQVKAQAYLLVLERLLHQFHQGKPLAVLKLPLVPDQPSVHTRPILQPFHPEARKADQVKLHVVIQLGNHHRLVLKVGLALHVELRVLCCALAANEAARAAPASCNGHGHKGVVGIVSVCPLTVLQAFPANACELDLDADRDLPVRGLVLGLLLHPVLDENGVLELEKVGIVVRQKRDFHRRTAASYPGSGQVAVVEVMFALAFVLRWRWRAIAKAVLQSLPRHLRG